MSTDEHQADDQRPNGAGVGLTSGGGDASGFRERSSAVGRRVAATLEERRGASRVIDTGFFVVERNRHIPAPILVGALAARLMIFVIPLLVLMVFVIGVFAQLATASPADAARTAGMAGLFAQATEDSIAASDGVRLATIVGVGAAVFWAAYSLEKTLRSAFALVWGVPRVRPRRIWLGPLGVIGFSLGSLALSSSALRSRSWPAGVVAVEALVELALVAVLWLLTSRALPHHPAAGRWRDLLPGAVLLGVAIVGMKVATVLYLAPRLERLDERYGPMALTLVMLTWAYWVGFVAIASADLNAAVFRARRGAKADDPPTTPMGATPASEPPGR